MVQSMGKIPLYSLSWSKFADLVKETYCPQHEVEKVETDFLTLVMKNLDCRTYVTDFNSMSRLVPYQVTPEPKRIACFIGGLALEVKGNVKASRPATYRSAVDLSLSLTLDVIRSGSGKTTDEGKIKREDDNSHRSDKKKKGRFGFKKNQDRSDSQAKPCGICKKKGHKTLECKNLKDAVCYGCNEKGHIKTNCPKNAKKPDEAKKGNVRAFYLNAKQAVNDDNVITGGDKSFVDLKFSELLNLPIRTLDIKYEVELADNHSIPLSLLPMKLAGFDVVLGMDGLSHNQARIACDKKLVDIKTPSGETITIQGDTHYGLPDQVSILKASKCLKSGCIIYMVQVTVDEPKPKIEDNLVIADYPDVFS
ncbi:uncharacterized protein LOC110931873 [Helianthus annuus]|uniref:uncharacterized protein LOC110931873 n=1 Tax=Helianthus annuus TaxID=4232 RepID=UPI000B9077FB|nr:uncharacterized protein LOC110931873 [Helianthus annuus]